MTEYELHQLIVQSTENLHSLNEIWLAISFGVVVAITHAPTELDRKYTAILFYGYFAAALTFMLARVGVIVAVTGYVSNLTSQGYDLPPQANLITSLASLGISLIMVVGSISILYYIRRVSKSHEHKTDKRDA